MGALGGVNLVKLTAGHVGIIAEADGQGVGILIDVDLLVTVGKTGVDFIRPVGVVADIIPNGKQFVGALRPGGGDGVALVP